MDFRTTIREAIQDFLENGFDSKKRLIRWQAIIKKTAERAIDTKWEQRVKNVLATTYKRNVTDGGIAKKTGIPAYKISHLSSSLRRELQQRQLASINLISSHHSDAVETIYRRFTGWATSRNPDQTSPESIRGLMKNFSEPVARMGFTERRIIIDQNAKLSQNLNLIAGAGNGAIAVQWDAFPDRVNYNHRQEHLARNGKIYLLKNSWAVDKKYVKRGPNPYYEDIDQCGELPFCSCEGVLLFNLGQLPDDCLTNLGREALKNG